MRKTSDIIWQDAQHQVLFEILDLIKDPAADSQVLYKLKDYTENHFALEERYMVEIDFPGRAVHIEAHNRFRQEIDQLVGGEHGPDVLSADGRFGDAQFRDIIATFLTEWLTRHVFGVDKELEQFILQSRIK